MSQLDSQEYSSHCYQLNSEKTGDFNEQVDLVHRARLVNCDCDL